MLFRGSVTRSSDDIRTVSPVPKLPDRFARLNQDTDKEMEMRQALLIDDEKEICELLCAMLKRTGTECTFAHSLEEGRRALGGVNFDAVFLDVNLPDGLGYELIPEIKAASPDARCIAISAMDNERSRAVAAGADVFIPKPFNRSVIFSSIRELGFNA